MRDSFARRQAATMYMQQSNRRLRLRRTHWPKVGASRALRPYDHCARSSSGFPLEHHHTRA
jgi:hypothetical protein